MDLAIADEGIKHKLAAILCADVDESLKTYSPGGPSHYYLRICEKYKTNPPGIKWD
jgi:hypothetical protein